MPTTSGYTDTVVRILTERLGPDALTQLAHARRARPAPDPAREALAEHLHTRARTVSRHEQALGEHLRRLLDFLTRAQHDLSLARTPTRWELIGISGTAIDQAVARYGEALDSLTAAADLVAELDTHLPTPNTPDPAPDTDTHAAR